MKKIVVFGTFDPIHQGHVDLFNQAKALGQLTIVVSHDDKVRLEKKREPRESSLERIRKIEELKVADQVILSDPSDKYLILEKLDADMIGLGYDQKIPEPLKNKVKKYKIISLKAFKPEVYKSSLIRDN